MKRTPLLEVEALSVDHAGRSGFWGQKLDVRAVRNVSFVLERGETLGLVGESGCGKSSLARGVLQLLRPSSGSVRFQGTELTTLRGAALREMRQHMQLVSQDPLGSLNGRLTVRQIIQEPLQIHRRGSGEVLDERVSSLLEMVGLDPDHRDRHPHMLSGGQRQRVGIARALALEPELLVCDEPVSALDVSVQAQILNLLADLRKRLGLTCLFISHDLAVVRHIADRIAVMKAGEIVECAPAELVCSDPRHPYTRALLDAVPIPSPNRARSRPRSD